MPMSSHLGYRQVSLHLIYGLQGGRVPCGGFLDLKWVQWSRQMTGLLDSYVDSEGNKNANLQFHILITLFDNS